MNLFKQTKQDRDYLALQELLKPVEEQDEATGILSKPKKPEDEESMVTGFFSSMFDRSKQRSAELAQEMQEQQRISEEQEISDYLRRTTVSDALYDELKLPNPAYGGLKLVEDRPMTEAELEQYAPLIDLANDIMEETITVKELGAMNRMDQEAFLKSLSDLKVNERSSSFEGDTFEVASSREEFLRDLMKKREADTAKPKDDEASRLKEFLLREETDSTSDDVKPVDTTTIDADGGAAPSGKGLMSPSTEETTTTEEVTKTVTDLVYDDFVGDKQEGDEAHVGQDNKNITLAGGVVPDGLKYDGKDFTQGSAEVVGFDKTKLDTSNAYKKVGSVTVKRSDFDSDKAFAKGVIEEFKKQAEKAAGDSWSKMSEGSKKAVVKIGWNKGTGWYTGESAKAIYTELAKEEPNATNLYSKILTGSTVKGGGASIGIAKARANAWNETISATGGKEIVKIEADNTGTNTAFKYYDKDGNLLHTEQTSRASTKYENKGRESISKNAQGSW